MAKLLIGSAVSALAIFVFGFVYWGFNPLPYGTLKGVSDDVATGSALMEHFPESGLYYLPNMELEQERLIELHEKGPIAMVNIQHEGESMMQPARWTMGIIHNFLSALLIGLLMMKVLTSLKTYKERVAFTTLAGVAAAVFSEPADAIWWRNPWNWEFFQMIYIILSWLIAGAILAKFLPAQND